jgi:hypothetical protein
VSYMNLGVQLAARGRLREADRLFADATVDVERSGLPESFHAFTAQRAITAFHLGHWGRAQQLSEHYVGLTAPAQSRNPNGDAAISFLSTSIARARGDDAAALAHAEQMLALARGWNYVNMLGRARSVLGCVLVEQGRREEAGPLADELLAMTDQAGNTLWFRWLIDLAWLLRGLGRPERPPFTPHPVWHETAQAIARGDLVAAADLLATTDMKTEEMYARLRAAEYLTAEGRCAEAQLHAEQAAAFYRSVDATAYLQRVEALLPALAQET